MNGELRLIHDQAHSGAHQMIIDESLFKNHIHTQDQNVILRFYHFSEPTLTVGYGVWSKVHQHLTKEISITRRITGGGIVSHKPSDLTYAFIAPYQSFLSLRKTRGSYLFIHEALKRALLDFDVQTRFFEGCEDKCQSPKTDYCFESPVLYDVMIGSHKLAGAGQKRTLGYLLHQGSIAWDLLKSTKPELSEIDFRNSFAKHLAEALNLTIKETPFLAEKLIQTATV